MFNRVININEVVYSIGLVFVLSIILVSLDDLIWDLYYGINRLLGRIKLSSIDVKDIEETPPKMLAVIVAAYNEETVLKSVITNLVKSNQYPQSMYHIFLGVYPNDPGTLRVAKELEETFNHVHRIIHVLEGPSSKADNLNNVIRYIYQFEQHNHLEFSAVVIHDSEDLVHPYEFKLENFLLETHAAIQMPVFPLQEMPKLSNLFKNMISGSYADEFAENHYRLLQARNATGAFVPSAGTGFVIRRDILDHFIDGDVFPVGSLTEDYKLSLQFKQMGYDVHYVLEDVKRLKADGSEVKEFISTRSMFPSNYKAAVKQKTRWIYGITRQTFQLKEIFKSKSLNTASKYSLYRDWKAKFGNLLLGPGYLVFVYFIISLFMDLPVMYPAYTFPWYLMLFLSVMMVQRQLLRFLAVKNVYGYRSAVVSTLFPPLLPIRMVVGNIINFHATCKAWLQDFASKKQGRTKKVKWSKTDHEFLDEIILLRYRRNLGDTLLYNEQINSRELDDALDLSEKTGDKLGVTLKRMGLVSEREITKAVCEITQQIYIDFSHTDYINKYIDDYNREILLEIKAVPMIREGERLVVLTCIDAPDAEIKKYFNEELILIYTTESAILEWINYTGVKESIDDSLLRIEGYVNKGYINVDQAMIALGYKHYLKGNIEDILQAMGLLKYLEKEPVITR